MKYVLVTWGVVSGLGKGVTASSIGLLLKACGLRVTSIKIGIFLHLSLSTHTICVCVGFSFEEIVVAFGSIYVEYVSQYLIVFRFHFG